MTIRKSSLQKSSDYLAGTSAQRPASPAEGTEYFNTSTGGLQVYLNGQWVTRQTPPAIVAPTSIVATNSPANRPYNNGKASVSFTPSELGGLVTNYQVTSSPGGYVANGTSSPIEITGLQSNTSYTYTVLASNSYSSANSSASAGVTATTVPQAPTITSVTAGMGEIIVAFTPNATGGESITSYTVTSSPGGFTASGSSSPLTVTGLTNGTTYTFTVTATNSNGTSNSSSPSSEIIPGTFTVEYAVIAGGGSGARSIGSPWGSGGGGGGGGSITSSTFAAGSSYTVTIGAGGGGADPGPGGTSSIIGGSLTISSGGGGNGSGSTSAGGGGSGSTNTGGGGGNGRFMNGQGNNGGDGYQTSISGTATYYGGGGAGAGWGPYGDGSPGLGGGGAANTGGGGNGSRSSSFNNGGSGIIILKYPQARTISLGSGVVGSTGSASGGYVITTITGGTGTISWS
jgi:hypothetical protein